jgi:hypothetical protein
MFYRNFYNFGFLLSAVNKIVLPIAKGESSSLRSRSVQQNCCFVSLGVVPLSFLFDWCHILHLRLFFDNFVKLVLLLRLLMNFTTFVIRF